MTNFEDMFTAPPAQSPTGELLLSNGGSIELDFPDGKSRAVITDVYIENMSDSDGSLHIMGDSAELYKYYIRAKEVKTFNYTTGLRVGSPATLSVKKIQIVNPSEAPLLVRVNGYFSA